MKYLSTLPLIIMIATITSISSCSSEDNSGDTEVGNWVITTPFKGSRRSGAISFTIDGKAYVGLGYSGDDYLIDFYEYDIALGFWKTKTPFPGTPRERAVAFSIGSKGYIGLGFNREEDKEELGDFWEYDATTDAWTKLSDFGGTARYNAVGFALGEKGYVGTGNDGSNYNGDFWEYDPGSDEWQEIISYPGQKREEAAVFILEGTAYLCTGRNNGVTNADFWQFDPEGKTWTNRAPDTDADEYDDFSSAVRRSNAVAFTIGGKAFIATGISASGAIDNTVWQFDPIDESWTKKTSFEGSARSQAVAFVLDERAFVGTGQSGSSRFDDVWEFLPDDEYDEGD